MKLKTLLLASGLALCGAPAFADGIYSGWPLIGGPSYCGTLLNGSCTQTIAPNESAVSGQEYIPSDYGPFGTAGATGVTNGLFSVLQLGNGLTVDQTTVGTTQTIPANVSYFYLDGAQGSALTVTMPASAVDGQIIHIICEAATVGTLTVAANTSVVTQVLKVNPNAACTAGVGYAWRYTASNLTWYRIQ